MTQANDRPDLSVLVASFNTKDLLLACLKSLEAANDGLRLEIFVVDNASSDGTPAAVAANYPEVKLIANATNEGFARANNRALKDSLGRYVLLLNPDTLIPPDTIGPMTRFLDDHPRVGMAGCRVDRPDGRLDEACKRNFPTPTNAFARFTGLDRLFPKSFGGYSRMADDPAGRFEVDSVVGAFMLVRREAVEEVGGLDEDYFMFGEDLDWAYRMKERDWAVWYVGDHRVIHHKGASVRKDPHRMNWHFHRSMILFHKKHLVDQYPFFVNWLVYAGISLRYALRSAALAVGPKSAEAALKPSDIARLRTRHGIRIEGERENGAGV